MGNYYVVLSAIICIAILIMLMTKKHFAEVCLPVISLIVLIIYLFGTTGKLVQGVYFIYGLAAMSFIAIVVIVMLKKVSLKTLFEYDLLLFLLGSLFIYIFTFSMRVCAGDEFTHWGSVVKNMIFTNTLSYDSKNWLYFPEYLPGTAIIEYLFCYNGSHILQEANIYRGMDIMLLAAYLPIFSFCKRKGLFVINAISICILLLVPLFFMPKTWLILQVDSLLLVLFANILLAVRFMKDDYFKIIYLCAAFSLLVLVKESGVGFAAFILIYALIYKIINQQKDKKWLILYSAIMVMLTYSWNVLTKLHNAVSVNKQSQSNINIKNILLLFSGQGEEWQYETIKRFLHKFLEPTYGSGGIFLIFALLMLLFPLIIKGISKKYDTMKLDMLINGISFVAYSTYLLFIYAFVFTRAEGLEVSSFGRYMGTFIGAWLLYYVALTCMYLKEESIKKNVYVVSAFIIGICLMMPIYDISSSFVPVWGGTATTGRLLRENYADSEEFAKYLNTEEDRVYIVSQFAERYSVSYVDYWVTRYNIAPTKTNEFRSYSFGNTNNEKDVNHVEMDVKEWERLLMDDEYSYVYIYAVDDEFVKEYGGLFEENKVERGLYSVNSTGGTIELKEVSFGNAIP